MSNAITVRGANKRYGDFVALDNVDFAVPSGSLTALLGPSGSGKSTLLRAIAGLDHPDSGTVTINGVDVTGVPPQRRGIGFVFQHYAAFKHMTVRDNVAFGLKIRKRPKSEIKDKVDNLLEVVGLSGFQTRYPNQLSGGQRQRMALARALAVDPQVLLLDEPFGALDAKVREDLRAWLRRLHDEVHVTTVLVTHDQAEAMALSDRILVMKLGVVQQIDTPLDVYNKPANKFVFSFIGLSNFLDIVWEDGRAFVRGENASLPESLIPPEAMRGRGALSLASRPSEIDFVSEGDGGGLRGVVSRKAFLGEIIDYQVKIGEQEMRVQKGRRAPGPEALRARSRPRAPRPVAGRPGGGGRCRRGCRALRPGRAGRPQSGRR